MENNDSTDFGIFLFKNSKTKASNETIFQEEEFEPKNHFEKMETSTLLNAKKWMKKFLKKIISPSLLHKPITPVSPSQLQTESQIKYQNGNEEEGILIELKGKVKRITRGNRRHKIKSRRQRNQKNKNKNKKKSKSDW